MTYKQLETLITDPRFQELKFRQERTNVFTIVGQTHTEHWHSAFLGWLLDAHSSLRLGHFPLARLLTLYMMKKPDCGFTLRDIYNWDLDSVCFCTEKDASYDGKRRSIDVYGESRELLLVIENKVNARENYNNSSQGQTMDYYRYAESVKKPGQRTLYFFITADQKQTCYADMYVQISYQEMFDSVISKCMAHPQVPEDGRYLLEQYAANLRETVRGSNTPMALVNVSLCKSLYDDYAETLDGLFQAVKRDEKSGRAGSIVQVEPAAVADCLNAGYVPVVSTVAQGTDEAVAYNVNADTAAAKLAIALGAEKLILLTDVRGLLRDPKDENTLIPTLHPSDVPGLIKDGVIQGGMIPKVDCCVEAVRSGVRGAHILDGRIPHSILIEMLSNAGVGTMIQ